MGLHAVWMIVILSLSYLALSKDLDSAQGLPLKTSVIKIIKSPVTSKISPSSKDRNSDSEKQSLDPSNNKTKDSIDLNVELALTPAEQEKGLMFRTSLKSETGMLFVFPDVRRRQFWMKNTLIPLSIAFIDEKKTIFQISNLDGVKTLIQTQFDRAESHKPAKYVLEVNRGWFLENKIAEGSTLSWPDEKKFIK